MQLLQRASLWTDESVTEDIFLITADAHHLFLRVHRDLETTCGLTQWTCTKNGAIGGVSHAFTLPRLHAGVISVRTLTSWNAVSRCA